MGLCGAMDMKLQLFFVLGERGGVGKSQHGLTTQANREQRDRSLLLDRDQVISSQQCNLDRCFLQSLWSWYSCDSRSHICPVRQTSKSGLD